MGEGLYRHPEERVFGCGAGPVIVVPATDVRWRGLHGYVAACIHVGSILRCCRRHHARCARVYRSLDLDRDVRACLDEAALTRLLDFLDRAAVRGVNVPCGVPLTRELRRAEIGTMRMEARNQLGRVRSGRAVAPRAKGPRLDPGRLPDVALDRLIQSHPDLALVERLRSERARRIDERAP